MVTESSEIFMSRSFPLFRGWWNFPCYTNGAARLYNPGGAAHQEAA